MELRELEAFLAVAEELHFGRAGERLYVSQSRISQLLRALERRIGGRLVDRTSRRVRLTPLGQQLFPELRAAYDGLRATLDAARETARGVHGVLRVGFQSSADERVLAPVNVFRNQFPDCTVELVEVPYSDPFGPLRRDEADVAFVLLPVAEGDLTVGTVLPGRPQLLAVPAGHRLTARSSLTVDDLAEFPLLQIGEPAPEYWRRVHSPRQTPNGREILAGPTVRTIQEAVGAVAAGRGALLLCDASAEFYRRPDVTFVPVRDIPSHLGLVWHRCRESEHVLAFARVVAAHPVSSASPPDTSSPAAAAASSGGRRPDPEIPQLHAFQS